MFFILFEREGAGGLASGGGCDGAMRPPLPRTVQEGREGEGEGGEGESQRSEAGGPLSLVCVMTTKSILRWGGGGGVSGTKRASRRERDLSGRVVGDMVPRDHSPCP